MRYLPFCFDRSNIAENLRKDLCKGIAKAVWSLLLPLLIFSDATAQLPQAQLPPTQSLPAQCEPCRKSAVSLCQAECSSAGSRANACLQTCEKRRCAQQCNPAAASQAPSAAAGSVRSLDECEACRQRAEIDSCRLRCQEDMEYGMSEYEGCIRTCASQTCASSCRLPGAVEPQSSKPKTTCRRCRRDKKTMCQQECGDSERPGFTGCAVACQERECYSICRPDTF